ncbi:hypothetical protein [Granulicella rosea]|uniref:hypothetical protein n=1 Tax=Granulicella rosea TaxID=474952 RepID=UPI001FE25461|nr:hypothetical protein [Granulicella rosea]
MSAAKLPQAIADGAGPKRSILCLKQSPHNGMNRGKAFKLTVAEIRETADHPKPHSVIGSGQHDLYPVFVADAMQWM